MNSVLNSLKQENNVKLTENGATAYKSTLNNVYDLFAFGGAYRQRSDADCINLFKNAYEENEELALKCLFYLRDCRDGQGERRFFRICFKWLCNAHPEAAKRNLEYIAEYGRWDDLIYSTLDTKLEDYALFLIKQQLVLDLDCKTPSLLGKWLPSTNASSHDTIAAGNKVRKYLKMTQKEYRKVLSSLRTKINIVEKLMSENRWDEIDFSKIPSKAGLIYKNAFSRRDLLQKKYENFIKNEKTTVNAKALYPYEIVAKALDGYSYWNRNTMSDIDRLAIEKYWNNLPNYFDNSEQSILCVVDTSGSMTGSEASAPINVAISLGIYCAERAKGPFQNHYISFSSEPQLIDCMNGIDFVDRVQRIYKTNLCENTALTKVFDLLKNMVLTGKAKKEDLPSKIIVLSDMEIDSGAREYSYYDRDRFEPWSTENARTTMEKIRQEWAAVGLKMPNLVYWNIESRQNTILDLGPNISLVSGMSPVIFQQVIKGVTGWELCCDKLLSERYECIK